MIYWDYNAGAPLLQEVAEHLKTAFGEAAGNPSSVHRMGREARRRFDAARDRIASLLGASPREVVFTASGSEAGALAVMGGFRGRKDKRRTRVVTTAIEHPAVLRSIDQLEREGAEVVRLQPNADGVVEANRFEPWLDHQTALVSLMWVNNETGCIQPAPQVARRCAEEGIIFHTDAVQAVGRLEATLRDCPADLLSLSAHKLGGPAGVAALLCRRTVTLSALIPGHQEDGRRGGTPNIALAEAMAIALRTACESREPLNKHLQCLRDSFEEQLLARVSGVTIHGAQAPRVANTSNVRFDGVDGEALLIALDLAGICASSGAACASGTLRPSHVLLAMGLTASQTQASLRFSLGHLATQKEVTAVVEALAKHVPLARNEENS